MEKLHSAAELTEYINKVGMLPLFRIVPSLGWSAEEVVDDDCQYVVLPDNVSCGTGRGTSSVRVNALMASSSSARRRSSVRNGGQTFATIVVACILIQPREALRKPSSRL